MPLRGPPRLIEVSIIRCFWPHHQHRIEQEVRLQGKTEPSLRSEVEYFYGSHYGTVRIGKNKKKLKYVCEMVNFGFPCTYVFCKLAPWKMSNRAISM
jgi:hypothetical protein